MSSSFRNAVFLFLAIACMAVPVAAQSPAPSPTLTNEQILLLRNDLKEVIIALEGSGAAPSAAPEAKPTTQTDQPAPAAEKAAPAKKNVADVADKALDMIARMGGSIYGTLEKAAPKVWAVMVRQQYVKAFSGVVVPAGLLIILGIIWLRMLREPYTRFVKNNEKHEKGDDVTTPVHIASWVLWGLATIAGIWFFVRVSDGVRYVINPEFYAARDMIMMIINPRGIE